jgi:hypothetical protein
VRHSSFTAVYDACVLYPAPLRDFLIRLGLSGRFRARWSAQIHDEWKRNLLLNRPDLTAEQLNRTSALMDRAFCSKTPTHSRRRSFVVAQHSTEASTATDGLGS